MKNSALKQSIGICALSLACTGIFATSTVAQEIESDLYNTPFDSCFVDGYNLSEVTAQQAYETANCFTTLLQRDSDSNLGASKHTILEYSVSWYQAAANKGNTMAQTNLSTNLLALSSLETGLLSQGEQMLASEQVFNVLDADNNGLLTVAEASSSQDLKAIFSDSDIDNDGMLSYGEYTISAGEATAAGIK